MALPTKVKTWQYANNIGGNSWLGSNATDAAFTIVAVKDALCAFSLFPYTVAGSSDGATAGMDAVDRWVDYADIVLPGGTHSWIVLAQPAFSTNAQLCIDFNSGTGTQATFIWSPTAGFTGGTTSARPTATDEKSSGVIDFFWALPGNGGFDNRAHVHHADDGKSTRILLCNSKEVRSWILMDVPQGVPSGWTDPSIFIARGGTGTSVPNENMSMAYWRSNQQVKAEGPVGDMPMWMSIPGFSTEGTDSGTYVGYDVWVGPDELTGEQPLSQIGVVCRLAEGLSGQRGWHGTISDLWWTTRTVPGGTGFPEDGSKDFVTFGNMVWAWDGGDLEFP